MRARANQILTIEGAPPAEGAGLHSTAAASDISLLDLLSSGPMPDAYPIGVHYDTACDGDTWLLVGARLFDPQRLSVNDMTLAGIGRLPDPDCAFDADELPLMLVTAAYTAQ